MTGNLRADTHTLRTMEASPLLALLPSPLLGSTAWDAVAAELGGRGHRVEIVPTPADPPRSPQDVLNGYLDALPSDREVVVVPHSNAGLYVPALASLRHVVGAVFVDAGLPPRSGEVPMAPPELLAALVGLAGADGLLPPWTAWWGDADVVKLFPSAEVRARIERHEPRMPVSYFRAQLTVPSGWDTGLAGAYLAFGDTYAEDRDIAAERGWPTSTMSGLHLHLLVDPGAVAVELEALMLTAGIVSAEAR